MNLKCFLIALLLFTGVVERSSCQISYNKKAIGSIGTAPKTGTFETNASLDNVDVTSGTLKISIPLYEIKVNDISVPITLSYSAFGIKVGQEAGPCGMGWELSAGGKISTNIQGKRDDLFNVGIQSLPLPVNIENPGVYNPKDDGNHKAFTQDVIDGKRDGAWDTYAYSLPNGSGGTYTKSGLTFPYDPLIVIEHPWKIKTTDGLVYNFTNGDRKQSKKRTYYEPNSTSVPQYIGDASFTRDPQTSEWFDYDLASIESIKFKSTVSFTYASITDTSKLSKMARVSTSESMPFYRNVKAEDADGGAKEDMNKIYNIGEPVISQSKTEYLSHTRIISIDFPNGRVSFDYGNEILGRDVMTAMRIYQKEGSVYTTLKRYVFNYDENEVSYGHYLIGIDVYDANEVKGDSWAFNYFQKLPVPPNKESVNTNSQDRWGFYNNAYNRTLLEHPDSVMALNLKNHYPIVESEYAVNSKLIYYTRPEATEKYGFFNGAPYQGTTRYYINFANRSFDFNHALKGTLTGVTTPTGAQYTYEYEPHKSRQNIYLSGSLSSKTFGGGGIRVKSITRTLGHDSLYINTDYGKSVKTRYEYGEGNLTLAETADTRNGYGQVTIPGNVLGHVSKYYRTSLSTLYSFNNIMLLSHPVNNMSQSGGSYGMYASVTKYITNSSGQGPYGKTAYFNYLPYYASAPDYKWTAGYSTWSLNDISLPKVVNNPGVQKEVQNKTYAVLEYAYKNGIYNVVKQTETGFKFFSAPLTSANKTLSYFGSLGAQLSGPLPSYTSSSPVNDNPWHEGSAYLYNQLGNSGAGKMDYYSQCQLAMESQTPNFEGKYAYEFINLAEFSNCIKKDTEKITVFDDNGYTQTITDVKYHYDNPLHLLPTRIFTKNSLGDSVITTTKYAQDYAANYPGQMTDQMVSEKQCLADPVEEYITFKKGGLGTAYIKNWTINTYKLDDGAIYSDKVFQRKLNSAQVPFSASGFNGGEGSINLANFRQQVSYDLYKKGNVHKYTELNGSANVVLWGYENQLPVAKVSNANNTSSVNDPNGRYTSADVAYTSFETSDAGNWTFTGTPVSDVSGPSGKKVYSLATGNITKTNGTPSTTKYILSYWYKYGASVTVTGGTVSAAVVKNTYGEWSYAEREVSAVSGTVTVSGTGYIDELRFHPYESQMTTYTYEPQIGISAVFDPKGKLQFYEYDSKQRLKNIKDQDGNIVKSYQYQEASGL